MGPWPESCPKAWGRPGWRPPYRCTHATTLATIVDRCRPWAWHAAGTLPSCHSLLGKPKVLVQGVQVLGSASSHLTASCPPCLVPEDVAEEKAALQPEEPLTMW